MKITKTAGWIFSVLFFITSSFNAQVVINELNADNPSGSDNQEFIELFAVVKTMSWKVAINRNLLTLDVSDLNAGVYLIKVDDSEGNVIQSNVVID